MRHRARGAVAAAVLTLVGCAGSGSGVDPSPTAALDARALEGDRFIEELLLRDPRLAPIAARAAEHRLQVLVSEVGRDERGRESLRRHGFRVDAEYFYPASSIKTCAAVAAPAFLRALSPELPPALDTPLVFEPLDEVGKREDADPSDLRTGRINVAHELRKLFLVSDNRAFNRLYELVGHRELNEAMWRAGLSSVRIRHRLAETRTSGEQRRTPRILVSPPGREPLVVPERASTLELPVEDLPGLDCGTAWVTNGGERREEPFDFRGRNRISLRDLQELHVALLRPELSRASLDLTDDERAFLVRAMREFPRESTNPVYDPADYPDEYSKLMLPGLRRVVPAERLGVYDKVGRAYGFSLVNAFVVDDGTGRSFFVTAVVYVNPNGTLNDGVYGYDEADRFLEDLGEVLARRLLVE